MLLIVTNKTDLTSDYLILKLKEQNIPFFRFNTEDYLLRYDVNIELSNSLGNACIKCRNKNIKIDLSDITGVYFRRPLSPEIEKYVVQDEAEFAQRESLEMLRSLWRMIDEELWLNHPKHLLIANNKVNQLKKAREIGFKIPETTISSDPKVIKRFSSLYRGTITKAVKHGFYKNEKDIKVALTREMTQENIETLNDFAEIPMIIQRRIEKTCDVRVTVVGNKVFATAIHSQDHNETKIDWRLWDIITDIDLKHTKIELPSDISEKCINITKSFNLSFSAIDLILSKDNEYYFLEMNPNGQWAWIEEKTGYPIRDAIISYFQKISKKREKKQNV